MGKTLNYGAFVERKRDDKTQITMPDGSTFEVDDPALWTDDMARRAMANDHIGLATEILGGEDAYKRFAAAGGNAYTLLAMLQDANGATVGESAASSS